MVLNGSPFGPEEFMKAFCFRCIARSDWVSFTVQPTQVNGWKEAFKHQMHMGVHQNKIVIKEAHG